MRGYQKHVISAEAPGPMSREELEREEIRAQEASQAGVDSKAAVVSGKFLKITMLIFSYFLFYIFSWENNFNDQGHLLIILLIDLPLDNP